MILRRLGGVLLGVAWSILAVAFLDEPPAVELLVAFVGAWLISSAAAA